MHEMHDEERSAGLEEGGSGGGRDGDGAVISQVRCAHLPRYSVPPSGAARIVLGDPIAARHATCVSYLLEGSLWTPELAACTRRAHVCNRA